MSLETLLTEHIFNIPVLGTIIIDKVKSIFNRKDQCQETNHRNTV